MSEDNYVPRWLWDEFIRLARQLPGVNFSIPPGDIEPNSVSVGVGDHYRVVIFDKLEGYVYVPALGNRKTPKILEGKISIWLNLLGF